MKRQTAHRIAAPAPPSGRSRSGRASDGLAGRGPEKETLGERLFGSGER